MILVQEFEQAIDGYWDGGPKSRFEWWIDGSPQSDKLGRFVRVSSWGANRWFHVAVGKTEKQTLGNARRRLAARAKAAGLRCKFSYE